MRLIDADDLNAKIMMEAPDFMDGGSSITKAFIMAMVKTRSATPTIDAVPVVRCKDCIHRDPEDKMCDSGHGIRWQIPRDDDWFCADGRKRDGHPERNVPDREAGDGIPGGDDPVLDGPAME